MMLGKTCRLVGPMHVGFVHIITSVTSATVVVQGTLVTFLLTKN